VTRATGLILAACLAAGGCVRPVRIETQPSAAVASPADVASGDALYPVQSVDGIWGYADASGRTVVVPQFEQAAPFNEGRAAVRLSGLWGYADPAGQLAVAPRYTDAGPFTEGRARVALGDGTSRRYGFVAPDGTVVVAPTLITATVYGDGLTVVRRQPPLTGIQRFLARAGGTPARTELLALDRSGAIALELPQREGLAFSEGRTPFRGPRNRWGYLRTDGEVAIEPRFKGAVFLFSEGLARVIDDDRVGFIDSTGHAVIEPAYDSARPFSEGLAAVAVGERWGYIDRTGRVVVPLQYDAAGPFSEGLAVVQIDGRLGYISPTGAVVITPQYLQAQAFRGGRAVVADGTRSVLITPTGERVASGDR
jgi:hypothetical protein